VRVSIVGSPGAGKTTFGRALASRTGSRFVELDAIVHQPGWTTLPPDELRAAVECAVDSEAWVIDGSYDAVRDLLLERATTVVWLDFPRRLVMRRVIRRSVRRLMTRQELWNGNRARWRSLFGPDHAVRRTWSDHHRRRAELTACLAEHADLVVHRFAAPSAAREWLDAVDRRSADASRPQATTATVPVNRVPCRRVG
jgi:adenylate kinase family enzyme